MATVPARALSPLPQVPQSPVSGCESDEHWGYGPPTVLADTSSRPHLKDAERVLGWSLYGNGSWIPQSLMAEWPISDLGLRAQAS
ncbi:MAG: hypothetical protein MK101_09755 [Phycisphaerales bacterium]|nr:hypothetical protein [Phycisphaerales bacterium]